MTKTAEFLLIGGGLASAFNADTLIKEGVTGKIIILSEENYLPYYRPQLPKRFLLGSRKKEQMQIFTEDFYKNHDIDVVLNAKAIKVDPEKRIVKTNHAGSYSFKQLLIATGCTPKKINIPGNQLGKIHYLKTLADAEPLIPEIKKAKKVVILGGSFIGIELASILLSKNIEVSIVTKQFHLYNVCPSEEIGMYVANQGVNVLLKQTIKKFNGKKNVESVVTSKGKTIDCDLVIITDEYLPDTDFLEGSGIEVNDGVVVDQYLQTNINGIYAAGDVANFYDPIYRRWHRNGGIDNAMKQGRLAALNMMQRNKSYCSASYFYFHAFDNPIVIIGDTADAKERIVRGSIKDKNLSFLYLKDNFLHGAFFSGRPIEEIKAAESIILNRVNLKNYKKKLFDIDFSLEKVAEQTILALQGGGALGSFECGVVKAMEEHGIYADIVAGISIGAFNAAIIAGNPTNPSEALDAFWNDLSVDLISLPDEQTRRVMSSWHSIIWGSPNFFYPRWALPVENFEQLPVHWTSLYDTSMIVDLLHKYVDFKKLKESPVRLLVMAVNVETSEFETFDSYTDDITAEHILASGSLPPAFPWTTINNKSYWDGGIVTNTPIDSTLEICGQSHKKIYIVELYSRNRALPQNMIEVLARKDEILFSEKIRNNINIRDLICSYKKLIERVVSFCNPAEFEEIKQLPAYIQLMGDPGVQNITRIIREVGKDEPYAWDSDFSRDTIEALKEKGYITTKNILDKSEP